MTGSSWGWLKLYGHYKAGHLPYAGGVLDQPNCFNEAMSTISSELNKSD